MFIESTPLIWIQFLIKTYVWIGGKRNRLESYFKDGQSNTHSSLEISMQGRLKSQPDMHTTSFNSVTSSQSSVDAIDSWIANCWIAQFTNTARRVSQNCKMSKTSATGPTGPTVPTVSTVPTGPTVSTVPTVPIGPTDWLGWQQLHH